MSAQRFLCRSHRSLPTSAANQTNVVSFTFFATFLPALVPNFLLMSRARVRIALLYRQDRWRVVLLCTLSCAANLALSKALALRDASSVLVVTDRGVSRSHLGRGTHDSSRKRLLTRKAHQRSTRHCRCNIDASRSLMKPRREAAQRLVRTDRDAVHDSVVQLHTCPPIEILLTVGGIQL